MSEPDRRPTLVDISKAFRDANRSVNRGCQPHPPAHFFMHLAERASGLTAPGLKVSPNNRINQRHMPLSKIHVGEVFSAMRGGFIEVFSPESHRGLPPSLQTWRRARIGPEVISDAAESIYLGKT